MASLGTPDYPYREQMAASLWNNADNTKQVIVQHTTESTGGNTNVIGFLERTQNGSYQTMVDLDGEEVRMVPDDQQAWAAMATGNRIGLHVCAMGMAAWKRDDWLSHGKLLETTAQRYAKWSQQYGIPLVQIGPDQIRAKVRGVCGHIDITHAFGESDHWDPGYEWPYDVVIARALEIIGNPTPSEVIRMSVADDELSKRFPSRSKYRKDNEPVDTLAGFILNIDARIHEESVEREALKGVQWAVDLVKREADKGDAGARAVLAQIGAK
ncbi:hypothetical protein C5E45_32685 [Nocardia nova]|uniref:N-acetylmuramoyl-L-alanine amidase domain-containing protein n=1 Tax=Nocardia nova TaxID=37330 RepID=A0A2S6ACS4_9NOCA|nr:N-acetylmuramoyl-L-alanine amidase [Nocardia nova]PPJ31849.1 hypothetical protein C5E45_32685 [Nocardia nova]